MSKYNDTVRALVTFLSTLQGLQAAVDGLTTRGENLEHLLDDALTILLLQNREYPSTVRAGFVMLGDALQEKYPVRRLILQQYLDQHADLLNNNMKTSANLQPVCADGEV